MALFPTAPVGMVHMLKGWMMTGPLSPATRAGIDIGAVVCGGRRPVSGRIISDLVAVAVYLSVLQGPCGQFLSEDCPEEHERLSSLSLPMRVRVRVAISVEA